MGLYDRDYYRRDEPSGILAGRSMMWNIIIANCVVFVLEVIFQRGQIEDGPIFDWLELPRTFWDQPWEVWRLVTYGFVHGGLFHLLGNMIGLWCFGEEVEDRYGRAEFLRIYLVTLVFGGLVWLVAQRLGEVPASAVVGASGAVVGIILLGVMPNPKRELMLFGMARVPAWFFAVLLILADVMGAYQRNQEIGGPVAHTVHLAGAAFAAAYFYFGWNLGTILPTHIWKRLTGPKLRVHRADDDEPRDLNVRVDEILAKISRTGEASLTSEERRTLEEASKRYQRRQR